jgi:tRNA pseudouridine13 synthase
VVEELPAYGPSGQGEHLYITFRKVSLTTRDAIQAIAEALGVDPRGAGHAGMKDRHAVTTQASSFPFPMARAFEPAVAALSLPGIEILAAARHDNKLKPGHLIGNRFTLVLRDVRSAHPGSTSREADVAALCARLEAIGREGVPNAFGPQRFGRDGDNADRALAWMAGTSRGPRDKRDQRLLFSALQSRLFNEVLALRVQGDPGWAEVVAGDIAKKHDTGGLFAVPLEGPELDEARARALAGAISATGPMFGARMRWPEGAPLALEREVLARTMPDPGRLEAFRHLGEGTRRSLRLWVQEMRVVPGPATLPDGNVSEASITASFVLPKGGYATTVLSRACRIVDRMLPHTGTEPFETEPADST